MVWSSTATPRSNSASPKESWWALSSHGSGVSVGGSSADSCVEFVDSFLLLKAELLISDEVTLIRSGFAARNAAFQDLLPHFFEKHARDPAHCELLLCEFLVTLEKYSRIELLRRFQELTGAFHNAACHVLLFAKAHVDRFLSARPAAVRAPEVLERRKSVFTAAFAEVVSVQEASALFGVILSSYNRVRTTSSRLAKASKLYKELAQGRESLAVVDLVPLYTAALEGAFEREPGFQDSDDAAQDEDSPWGRHRATLQSVERQYEDFFGQQPADAQRLLSEAVRAGEQPNSRRKPEAYWEPSSPKPRSYPVDERLADEIRAVMFEARRLREAERRRQLAAAPRHGTASKK